MRAMETSTKKPRSKKASRKSSPPPPPSCKRTRKRRAPSPAPAPPTPHKPSEFTKSPPKPHSNMPDNNPCPSSSSQSQAISCSAHLRAQGNALYKQASAGGFCFTIKRAKIMRALQFYTQALHASTCPDERASCCKNLGMLHFLSCKLELNQKLSQSNDSHGGLSSMSTKHLSVCKIFLFDTIRSLVEAKVHGENCKPTLWLDQLQQVLISIVKWVTDQSSLLPISHSPLLQYLCEAFEDASPVISSSCLLAYKNHADALFKEALAKRLPDKTMDYKSCHSLLHDCSVSLRKGNSHPGLNQEDKSLQQEMQELQGSVNVHICICQAMQAITLGDMSLSQALLDDEEMDMEKVKDSLDYYRQASLATRELDMETEALAMSRIGKVYSDVLKLHEAAHKYHFQATRLALTVMSPSIARAEWYIFSSEKVKAHQERVAAVEREQHEKDREPAVQRLKQKLAALSKQASYSAESFLKYVYAEHPHPDLKRNVVPLLSTNGKVKSSLKKAILHYHPDSNMQFGNDWTVLCEEICKHLNDKYACFKGVST